MNPANNTDDEDDLLDDEDEREGFQLESSTSQKVLWPFYILIFLIFLCTMSIPFLIIYTMAWQAWQAQQ